jgi:predicted acylesterase/phospholipase RssA
MFGAYHVGAWKVLSKHFEPELVVGSSIGSLLGYLVACGYPIEEIEREWLSGARSTVPRWRVPKSLLEGLLVPDSVHAIMREMTEKLQPKTRFAAVALSLPRFRTVIFESPGITWQHLAASCAIPFVYDAQRIDGRIHVDCGPIRTCPIPEARQLGATEIIALNCVHGGSRRLSDDAYIIGTKRYLGTPRSGMVWKRDKIERWIAQGERDASEALACGEVCRSPQKTFA